MLRKPTSFEADDDDDDALRVIDTRNTPDSLNDQEAVQQILAEHRQLIGKSAGASAPDNPMEKRGCTITRQEDVDIVHMGTMEIWDGANLAALRDTVEELAETMHSRSIGIDLSFVQYLPSGFFSMLYNLHEKVSASVSGIRSRTSRLCSGSATVLSGQVRGNFF